MLFLLPESFMTISPNDLEKIARLSYLQIEPEQASQLTQEVGAIMDFVDELRDIDTTNVAPLVYPFASHQRLRPDTVTEQACIAELEQLAPLFENDLYLVPKVIDSGK